MNTKLTESVQFVNNRHKFCGGYLIVNVKPILNYVGLYISCQDHLTSVPHLSNYNQDSALHVGVYVNGLPRCSASHKLTHHLSEGS